MKQKNRLDSVRTMSWFLLVLFVVELLLPATSFAGGPSQPEVQSFTPVSVSNMVDPFTGDFSYNLPLMDVEGYPLNISYNAGVSMDQEASWVGLGWNLNVGSVDRSLRGIPDDFNGDIIAKEVNMKPNRSYGIDLGADIELFGKKFNKDETKDTSGVNLNVQLGVTYNNYNGFSTNFSFGPSFDFLKSTSKGLTAGFSLSGSSENGSSFSPSVSLSKKYDEGTLKERTLSGSIGTSFNSRAGLTYVSYDVSKTRTKQYKENTKRAGKDYTFKSGLSGSYSMALSTYSPSASHSMKNVSIRGKFKAGTSIIGTDVTYSIGLSYSSNWIPDEFKKMYTPSYGYLNLEKGRSNPNAILDFNRDNDASFSKYSSYIASAHLTNDIFTVKAQGISGSYKPFRTDIGYVFDPETKTISHDGSFGVEAGAGQAVKLGFDASYNRTSSYTGMWKGNSNRASDDFLFLGQESYGMVRTPFIEASESAVDQDQTFSQLGSDMSVRFDLSGSGLAPKLQDDIKNGSSTFFKNDPPNKRTEAVKRNQMMYFLTIGEVKKGMGISNVHPDLYSGAKDHHIGEITQLGTDGRRYVFGLPAYNYFQEDVTFSTGYNNSGQHLAVTSDYTGLVDYTSDANALSTSNKYGRDNYYMSETKSPYAHAFLLTSVLSDDYVDVDDVKGPSKNDLGGYVKFDYQKVANHKWRNPIEENKAYHNEGMRSDLKDDKASIVYGEKELWYVKAIESKNYVAIFTLENRADGFGVTDRHGGVLSGNPSSKLIRKISLYNKADYEANPTTAIPIQEVHFEYSYELCQGYPGNNIAGFSLPAEDTWGSGKLTLKKIYFTYQYSNKMKQSPYTFVYSTNNPPYNLKAVDRWGNYKPNSAGNEHVISSPITNSEYPYAIQDKVQADANASAWNLVRINLPSGGQIDVEYESDDYGFVQHLPAMEMCKIIGTEQDSEAIIDGSLSTPRVSSLSNDSDRNVDIIVAVDPTVTDSSKFIKPKDQLAFKALMKVRNGNEWDGTKRSTYEYVSGYAKVKEVGFYGTTPGKLKITLEPENLKDNGDEDYNPIVKTAIQFGRMYLSETVTDGLSSPPSESTDESSFKDFANSFLEAFDSYKELFSGPNLVLWEDVTLRNILTLKSFVRLNVVDKVKLGGGHRVKRILMRDNWNSMAGGVNQTTGQEFKYINEDGTSSGVASYEPQLGGDENPWHKPFLDSKEKKRYELGTSLFVETPIMESLFPSPSVGYSRVEIKDIVVPNGALNQPIAKVRGTGKVVKEFFTAKDFPTFYSMTDMYNKTANSFLPLLPKYQYATVTQGFAIELNDMHGKPKSEKVYAEGAPLDAPLSTVEYEYLSEDVVVDGYTVKKLKNQVPTIDAQGNYQSYEMGVKREAVTDFRESTTKSIGGAMEFNVNGFVVFLPIIVPTAWPSIDISKNSFRSASFNKIINRFGIQSTTTAVQDGASVTTSNLAYDKETGEVLVTKTQTNFKDDVYSLNYPAYWKYAQLGQAYKNQGVVTGKLNLNSNGFAVIQNANNYFVEGDEVSVTDLATGLNTKYGWVVSVSTNGINVMDKQGLPIEMLDARIKVIRSGYRNKQSTSMASLVSRTNPIPSIKTNQYKDILNAGAVEFGQDWKTYCDCFGTTVPATTNPYVLGTKGNWRPVRSLTHLTERTQSNYNGNSNIRQDGMFMSYTPYYKMVNGKWDISPQNWTFVSEVTQFSPNGMTLETRDALNRYSATTFGFNNTLTTAVGVNTKYRQIGFASFEDAKDVKCFDKHFKFDGVSTSNLVSDSHTGKTSVRVSSTSDVKVSVTFSECAEVSCSGLGVQGTDKPETFNIVGGTAPYQIEYEVISGNAEVQLFLPNNQVGILTQGLGYHEVEYKITDANGCILIKRFSITK